jgi:hypothetical protein
MSLLLAIALVYILKDHGVHRELKMVRSLFNKSNRKQAIIETGVLLGCMTVIVYGSVTHFILK